MQANLIHAVLKQSQIMQGLRLNDGNVETLAANKTLAVDDALVQVLDPGGGARTLTLPDPANVDGEDNGDGLLFIVINTADAAESITVNDHNASAVGSTVDQNGIGIFIAFEGAWYGGGLA